ncbi:type III-B CRISPR-associated protein Cas10/Cmr2 [Clostridium fermenticellae]|uniref:Type III-B CRISPR-associated protein Cas10/Cmr2 n=1 Tax=Clostridium fermenticellae TaxID=2068654 RepID=A0A386H3G8_9CLOT|nr:type III-B CRISPR-associated protein Cas10/Cmr2 [Clostridium fermenticellae]AYD40242.1 type III-B CRISPR-associated protein Cas10/Cmr2 [Clostridium fermenticellae]
MSKRIILFSIGSVQDFIINSKKLKDLFNSSKIFSSLIEEGIEFLLDKKGKILLPKIKEYDNKTQESINSNNLPNYFIAKYESEGSLAKDIEKHIRDFYIDKLMREKSIRGINEFREQICIQLNSSLNIYWVEKELNEDFSLNNSKQYKAVYEGLYKYLEAVKNVRKFNNISEEGMKCSICGVRNAIATNKDEIIKKPNIQRIYRYELNEKSFSEKSLCKLVNELRNKRIKVCCEDIRRIKQKVELDCLNYEGLKENEMLCGVCLLKRVSKFSDKKGIKSIAYICLSSYIKKNLEKDIGYYNYYNFIDKIIQENKNHFDIYESMYKENWDDLLKIFEEEKKEKLKIQLEEKFNNLYDKNLPKYYCLYRMDIDNLGKWMSGKYYKFEEELYDYQKSLSEKIDNFFNKISEYFNEYSKGNLIYSGGDDLLALIPVDTIYNFQNYVYKCFKEKINDKYKDITYSQGIFIVHYKAPLGEVIRISKEEIENTKNRFKEKINDLDIEKASTVISIMTEGYDNQNVYFKNTIGREKTFEVLYVDLFKYFDKDNSSYFYEELEKEFLNLDYNIDKSYKRDLLLNIFEIEQKRLMKRSIMVKNFTDDQSKEIDKKVESINSKLINFLKINGRKKNAVDLENYFNLFHIIRKLKLDM